MFFSIVIPTKNRPALLRGAIQSALLQNFDDYELVVSDNCNDERTLKVVEEFRGNPHLVYIRAQSERNMPDHWEFATQKASGTYVLVLTDRSVLRQGALRHIHQVLADKPEVDVASWGFSGFEEEEEKNGCITTFVLEEGEPRRMQCNEVLVQTAEEGFDFCLLPRGLNSCYRNTLGAKIRAKHGALFQPISPDMTSAFLLLSYGAHLLHLPRTMLFLRGASLGNGHRSFRDATPYLKTLPERDWYEGTPVKAQLMENVHYSDFLAVQSCAEGNIKNVPINWTVYFLNCYKEILKRKHSGIFPQGTIAELEAAWRQGLRTSDEKTQENVERILPKVRREATLVLLKKKAKNAKIWPLVRHLRAYIHSRYAHSAYKTALEAAGFSLI